MVRNASSLGSHARPRSGGRTGMFPQDVVVTRSRRYDAPLTAGSNERIAA